eukprot:10788108-Prorocentrum_lima.AAC.1
MTSSLVGSEMCIRDRNRRGCETKCKKALGHMRVHKHGQSNSSSVLSADCLLYTSDAADDM